MARRTNYEKRAPQQEALLAAYARLGLLRRAVEEAGLNQSHHYRWFKGDPAYRERFTALEAQIASETLANRRPHPRGYKIKGARVEERKRKQEAILAALKKTGIVLDAARETGVSAASFYTWFREDPEFAGKAAPILEETRELAQRIKAERTGAASRASWDDPARREAWGEFQRENWTPEMRAAAGERNRERQNDPEFREAWLEATRAASASPEGRAANSERMKRLWADPEHRARYIAAIADEDRRARLSEQARQQWEVLSPGERKEKMRSLRRVFKGGHRLSQIEADVLMALNDRDVAYQAHKWIDGYVADIVIPSLKLVIEADGAQFHPVDGERETARDEALKTLGYRTLRLTEKEIKAKDWTRLDQEIASLTGSGPQAATP